MDSNTFYNFLLEHFPYAPTSGQKKTLYTLSRFVLSTTENPVYLLKGYAGTGKTTVVSTLVNALSTVQKKSVLLAPTGRAAKVLAGYSGRKAFTIHKKIYLVRTDQGGQLRMALSENKHTDTVFFVDESSMISDQSGGDSYFHSGNSLLDDLFEYVFSNTNNKLVLIGDSGQLPPVNLDISPALDLKYIRNNFSNPSYAIEIDEVVRQSLQSGILANATKIRSLKEPKGIIQLITDDGYPDIIRIDGEMLEEELQNSYNGYEWSNTVVITRSNKRANVFNQEIRNRILFRETEIAAGDLLMIVRNNYYWVDKNSSPGFLANGDIIEITKVIGYHELYGNRFADITARLLDYPDENELDVRINLDTLMVDGPSLPQQDHRRLFKEIMEDYQDEPSRRKRIEQVKNNPFYNALQVKYAYALTCHKTQGGQWENVFVDLGYLNEEHLDKAFYRWLYTAFTRATKKLFLLNFPDSFFV